MKLLSLVMDWDDNEAAQEFDWLSFMASYKYDGYRDYCAGARFIESFATWLQQFDQEDRPVAYDFVKERLIYFSPREIERLVEKLVPEIVQRHLIHQVAGALKISPYRVWSSPEYERAYTIERRKTLFMGLSDGARIDVLRRMNADVISNEQVVIATQIDSDKWKDLLTDLRKDIERSGDGNFAEARFNTVYLIDDFTASGTSILPDPDVVGALKGKLVKFLKSVKQANDAMGGDQAFSQGYKIYVHHYIATEEARRRIAGVHEKIQSDLATHFGADNIQFTFGMLLPDGIAITEGSSHPFAALCQRYYDDAIEGKGTHSGQSGITGKVYGYANCGLPVVLEHNTPNNSLSLLHARTDSNNGKHNMRPLFHRRERHSDLEQAVIPNESGAPNE